MRSKFSSRATALAWLAVACVTLDADPPPDPWDEFVAAHAVPMPDGAYLFQGDVRVSEERLRAIFESMQGPTAYSTVNYNAVQGDFVWNAAQRLELTYCLRNDFGTAALNARVKAMMQTAANSWERASDVNFIHLTAEDGSLCTAGVDGVLFHVRLGLPNAPECLFGLTACPNARAFFPNDGSTPELVIWSGPLEADDAELGRVLRHELGHTLGMYHEHFRFEQELDGCIDSAPGPARGLTPPDADSVMGYSWCNGIGDGNTELSVYDRLGLRYLYGLPRRFGRNEYFNFKGGLENDVFWHVPNGTWQLYESVDDNTIDFAITDACDYGQAECTVPQPFDAIPFAAQWRTMFTAESVFLYGRGDKPDGVLDNMIPEGDGMPLRDLTLIGYTIPLTGHFHRETLDARHDVFWYNPGSPIDAHWHPNDDLTESQKMLDQPRYFDPLVGNFRWGDPDEIVWRDPVSNNGFVWTSDGNHNFTATAVDFASRGVSRGKEYIPIYGEFNGDGFGDILWYGPGKTADKLWLGAGTMTGGVTVVDLTIDGYYKPIAADFTGDNITDILWYGPGFAPDVLWKFRARGGHDVVAIGIDGDFSPIAGNFNSDDWCADILWYQTDQDLVIPFRSNCNGTFVPQAVIPTPANAFPVGYALGR